MPMSVPELIQAGNMDARMAAMFWIGCGSGIERVSSGGAVTDSPPDMRTDGRRRAR